MNSDYLDNKAFKKSDDKGLFCSLGGNMEEFRNTSDRGAFLTTSKENPVSSPNYSAQSTDVPSTKAQEKR